MSSFHFMGCVELKELLGRKADDEAELLELLEEVPADSIYYHTHCYFLHHVYIAGPYPNDFANWAAIQVRDRVLGEKLSVVTPSPHKDLEAIRVELMDIVDEHLSAIKINPAIVYGQPFYFMKSRIAQIPTGITVKNLGEFSSALLTVDATAIYNHIFEARMRLRKGKSDFSLWIEEALGNKELADKIEGIDAYMYSLEDLRIKLVGLCEEYM